LRVPKRSRGVLAGLATLCVVPLMAVSVAPPSAPVAQATAAPLVAVAGAHRTVPLRVPEVMTRETLAPTATPAAVTLAPARTPRPTPSHTPKPSGTPAPAPAPAVNVPAGSIEGIIRAAAARHGVSGDWMVKIARCESGLRPRAYNPAGPYYGLFQFLQSTFRAHGGTDIWDPYQQSEITATMLSQGGARQWGCA
jgi:soluble lytic murein transglycosylase-like protein